MSVVEVSRSAWEAGQRASRQGGKNRPLGRLPNRSSVFHGCKFSRISFLWFRFV